MAFFSARTFSYAKDSEQPEANQDFVLCDGEHGRAIIADGVSSAIFSRSWARILAHDIADALPPDFNDTERFNAWLAKLRERWFQSIDSTQLAWYQRPKLASGAFSTLLWFQLEPCLLPNENEPEFELAEAFDPDRRCFLLTGWTIGDSCLFHVRQDKPLTGYYDGTELMNVFPIEHSDDFSDTAIALGSVNLGRDSSLQFTPLRRIVQEGDWLILATDAISQWLLRLYENGISPDWNDFWNLTEADFDQEIEQMRLEREIGCDDTTLALLYVGEKAVTVQEPMDDAATQSDYATTQTDELPQETLELPLTIGNPELENAPSAPMEMPLEFTEDEPVFTELPPETPAPAAQAEPMAHGQYSPSAAFAAADSAFVPSAQPTQVPEFQPVPTGGTPTADFASAGQPTQAPAFQPNPKFQPASGFQPNPEPQPNPDFQPVPEFQPDPDFQLIAPAFKPEESAVGETAAQSAQGSNSQLGQATTQGVEKPETGVQSQDARQFWIQKSSEWGNQMSETFQQVTKKSAQLADAAGERISDGVAHIGEKTNSLRKRLSSRIRSLWSKKGQNADDSPVETEESKEAGKNAKPKSKPKSQAGTKPNAPAATVPKANAGVNPGTKTPPDAGNR